MPIYVVRWPDFSAALVRAVDEDQLVNILDEFDNPEGCSWAEYHGPLFIHFQLAATVEVELESGGQRWPPDPRRLRVTGAAELASREHEILVAFPCEETGEAMVEAICRFAFPATAAVYWGDRLELDPGELEQALKEDAVQLVQDAWRQAHLQRSSDPDDRLAFAMDTSPRCIQYRRQQQLAAETDETDKEDELGEEKFNLIAELAQTLALARLYLLEEGDLAAARRELHEVLRLME